MTKEMTVNNMELKPYSITIEEMIVGGKLKLCLIVKILDKETEQYKVLESTIPKTSVLGLQVLSILKNANEVIKNSLKKSK
jgi:hypothetical protein